ncbi:LOW QUALITY PROTEIN: hypothetical protein U9M48_038503 [Paspalum notatum var. saurae]|uniref:Uncharacterized protein n=1 Tax=Paspalum notatum var. saurae TaxID=547442 RepID=A0AAQ3UJE7_PASNO
MAEPPELAQCHAGQAFTYHASRIPKARTPGRNPSRPSASDPSHRSIGACEGGDDVRRGPAAAVLRVRLGVLVAGGDGADARGDEMGWPRQLLGEGRLLPAMGFTRITYYVGLPYTSETASCLDARVTDRRRLLLPGERDAAAARPHDRPPGPGRPVWWLSCTARAWPCEEVLADRRGAPGAREASVPFPRSSRNLHAFMAVAPCGVRSSTC